MHSLVICVCDGKLDVLDFAATRWEMLYHFIFALIWIYSLSNGRWFLCVASLRGY